ncbi:MAG: hypothetical protein V4598_00315 [Bdellovibrionota bacterium]
MMNSKFLTAVFFILLAVKANAQNDQEGFRFAIKACAEESGIVMEEGIRPSQEDHAKIQACMTAKGFTKPERKNDEFHSAIAACALENNLTLPERGARPSEEDRAKIDACLTAKGISKPEHHRPQRRSAGVSRE